MGQSTRLSAGRLAKPSGLSRPIRTGSRTMTLRCSPAGAPASHGPWAEARRSKTAPLIKRIDRYNQLRGHGRIGGARTDIAAQDQTAPAGSAPHIQVREVGGGEAHCWYFS